MPSRGSWSLALAVLFLGACGGGGGGGSGAPVGPLALDLGLVSSTAPTRAPISVANPANVAATFTAGTATVPFALDTADLPVAVGAGASATLHVVFTPRATGLATGTVVVLATTAGGSATEIPIDVTADAEPVTLVAVTPSLAFGEVLEGDVRTLAANVRNASSKSGATISAASLPAGGFFSLAPGALPRSIAPGATASFDVRYEPAAVGAFAGTLRLAAGEPGGPVDVALSATTGGEVVTSYGSVAFGAGGLTSTLTVEVPADATSLYLEAVGATSSAFGLGELLGPGGVVYENTSSTGAYVWIPGQEVFSTVVPNTDRPGVQLAAGGGTYSFRISRLSGGATGVAVRAIVGRRPGGTESIGVLDLDVWLAKVLTVKAATAATDARLQSVLSSMGSILGQQGIRLGDVRYHDLSDPAYDDVTDAEFGPMLALTASEPEPRLNLFFVRTAIGGGVLGMAATVAGPKVNGTQSSGVMSLYEGYAAETIGLVAAHEVGHFLGLYHTVESDGTHDYIDDTAECPASGTNLACPVAGGGYLMHWQAVGGTDITDGQGRVLRAHPDVGPDVPTATALRFLRAVPPRLAESLPAGWCGTCRAPAPKR